MQFLEVVDYPRLVAVGQAAFAEDGDCMAMMQDAIAKATGGKIGEILRDTQVWSQIQESPELLRRTLLKVDPAPPVVLSDSSSDTDSSDE